jgi:uncharacterized membrane protein YfcA
MDTRVIWGENGMDFTKFVVIGILAGIVSGLLGIGGGIIIVPALIYFAGFSQLSAVGTSLAVMLPPIGLAAVTEYYRQGHVDFRAAIIIALCMLITAGISAHYAGRFNPLHLRLAFGLFIIIVGMYMIFTSLSKG